MTNVTDVAVVKNFLTARIAEYAGKKSERVMIWVNERRTDLGGYCIDSVPRHIAPVICAAIAGKNTNTTAEQSGYDRAIAEVVAWLKRENDLCDCYARSETECACGAWDGSKSWLLCRVWEAIEAGEHRKD